MAIKKTMLITTDKGKSARDLPKGTAILLHKNNDKRSVAHLSVNGQLVADSTGQDLEEALLVVVGKYFKLFETKRGSRLGR